jgi:pimeloyl-ACP methyl ester carboxylesterase
MEGSEYEELIQGASLSMFGPYFYKKAIEAWPVQPRKSPQEFHSEVPLLLLGGKFDHLCKPSYAAQLAEEQVNATLFLFEDVVHSPVDKGPCAIMMLKEFYDDPSKVPDSTCMQAFHHEYKVSD